MSVFVSLCLFYVKFKHPGIPKSPVEERETVKREKTELNERADAQRETIPDSEALPPSGGTLELSAMAPSEGSVHLTLPLPSQKPESELLQDLVEGVAGVENLKEPNLDVDVKGNDLHLNENPSSSGVGPQLDMKTLPDDAGDKIPDVDVLRPKTAREFHSDPVMKSAHETRLHDEVAVTKVVPEMNVLPAVTGAGLSIRTFPWETVPPNDVGPLKREGAGVDASIRPRVWLGQPLKSLAKWHVCPLELMILKSLHTKVQYAI